jgi:hypothetical protein
MPVSRRLRYEVLRRDSHTCRYCGAQAPDVKLTVDHVIPVTLGGGDEPKNLVTACADCNAGKSSIAPDAQHVEDVSADALRWAAAIKEASALQMVTAECRAEYIEAFDAAWRRWTYKDGSCVSRPSDWRSTIGRHYDADLEIEMLTMLVNDVLPRQVADDRMWVYFCGALRNVMRERTEMAASLIKSGWV